MICLQSSASAVSSPTAVSRRTTFFKPNLFYSRIDGGGDQSYDDNARNSRYRQLTTTIQTEEGLEILPIELQSYTTMEGLFRKDSSDSSSSGIEENEINVSHYNESSNAWDDELYVRHKSDEATSMEANQEQKSPRYWMVRESEREDCYKSNKMYCQPSELVQNNCIREHHDSEFSTVATTKSSQTNSDEPVHREGREDNDRLIIFRSCSQTVDAIDSKSRQPISTEFDTSIEVERSTKCDYSLQYHGAISTSNETRVSENSTSQSYLTETPDVYAKMLLHDEGYNEIEIEKFASSSRASTSETERDYENGQYQIDEIESLENTLMENKWIELQLVGYVKVLTDSSLEHNVIQHTETLQSNRNQLESTPDFDIHPIDCGSHVHLEVPSYPQHVQMHQLEGEQTKDGESRDDADDVKRERIPNSVNIDDTSYTSPLPLAEAFLDCYHNDELYDFGKLDLALIGKVQDCMNEEFRFDTFDRPYRCEDNDVDKDKNQEHSDDDHNAKPPDVSKLEWIPKLIIFLSSDRKSIVEASLSELAQMGCIEDQSNYDDDLSAMRFISTAYDGGAHSSIVGAMNRWYHVPEIQLLGCRALHNFGINRDFREAAGRSGAFETLLQAMENFPSCIELEKLATACLCCLSANKDMAMYLVLELNGLEPILRTMKKHVEDGFVQLWSCSAINYMSNFPELVPHMEAGGALIILLNIIRKYNDLSNPDHYLIQNQAREAIKCLL